MTVPGRVRESMDRIFARIIIAEEQEGIKFYYGNELWETAGKDQNRHLLSNIRSQPYTTQRAAVERIVLSTAIEKALPEYAKRIIEMIISIPPGEEDPNFAVDVAAKCGNVAILKLLLNNDAYIADLHEWHGTYMKQRRNGIDFTLASAAEGGHEAVVRLLLEKGADIEWKSWNRHTAFIIAVEAGHDAVVRLLLEKGADIEWKSRDGDTALTIAAEAGHEAVVRLLLEKGADIERKSWDGDTAFIIAAEAGHDAVVRLLLEKGADIERKSRDGDTALTIAAEAGHDAVVRLLLEKGADIEWKSWDGNTALTIAAEAGHEAVVRLLLEKGADIERKSWDGDTAFIIAAEAGHEAVVRLLLEKGADIERKSRDSDTALIIAAEAGHEAVVRLLLEKGADIERKSRAGDTAFIIAAEAGHEAVVRLLLEKGADIERKSRAGDTAFIIAAEAGHDAVVRLLLEKGADIERKSWDGDTALTIAAEAGHEAVVRLLLERNPKNIKRTVASTKQNVLETSKIEQMQAMEHEIGASFKISDRSSLTFQRRRTLRSDLIEAAKQGREKLVSELLKESSLLYYASRTLGKALIEAAKQGHEKVVAELLKESPLRYCTSRTLEKALIEAAKQGHGKVVAELLKESPLRYCTSRTLEKALIEAAKQGHEKVVAELLKVSPLRYCASRTIEKALIEAAKHGHETVVMCIHSSRTWSPISMTVMIRCLFMAVQNGHSQVVDALLKCTQPLDRAAVVNSFDENWRTALHWAVENGDEKIVTLLIEAGSSVAFLDSCGVSPLQLAAVSGVSPLELDAARICLAEKDSPADTRHLLNTKMELGLGFGEPYLNMASRIIQLSADTHNSSLFDEGCSLYDFILHGIARSLGSSTSFEILSNPTYTSLLQSWGSSLIGGHIRITTGRYSSVIVGIDRLFGFGSKSNGLAFLQTLIMFEVSLNGEPDRFRLRQAMRASSQKHHSSLRRHQLLLWFVALAHTASKHQEQRARAIQNKKGSPTSVGSCWRDAFGDVLEVDLQKHFNVSDAIRINPTIWPQNGDRHASFSNDLSFSTMEDLASAMGIYSETSVDGMLFWKGYRGICVLVGALPHKNLLFWHVCTIEQSSYLEFDPESFVRGIKSTRDAILEINSEPQHLCDCNEVTSFQGTILVGALIEPGWCEKVNCDGLFQAQGENIEAGRLAPDERRQGLQWSNLSGQLQLSMGAQGPQGSVVLGGELARNSGHELLMAENSLAHGLTILERALRSWVLVYQSSNGQVVQQNLYCIVSCFLMSEQSENTFHQESCAGIGSAQEWCNSRVTLIRVCSSIVASPMPAFLNGKIGGLDLAAIVKECARIWVWELPLGRLGWVKAFGMLPAVSVRSLGEVPNPSGLQRCTLLISVGCLEQRVGRLYRVETSGPTFESEMVRIELRGFNEASLEEAQRAAQTAKTLRWTKSIRAVRPGRRFGGQGPSLMEHLAPIKIWDYFVLLASNAKDSVYTASCETLGTIVNGTELTGDSVGLLIECT